jgi:hypothetical protein
MEERNFTSEPPNPSLHNTEMFINVKIGICEIIILPVVLYAFEILCLTLREEHRLEVFESWVLRRIFGPKSGEVIGG